MHRAYQFFADDLERVFIDRYNPRDRSMGAVLARLNKRVTEHFAADQAQWALQDGDEARVRAMARKAETGAGSWQYEPLAAHLPSSGRANPQPATSLDYFATAHHRLAAEKIAARYGYGITPDGQIASY